MMSIRFAGRAVAPLLITLLAALAPSTLHADSLDAQYQAAVDRIHDQHNERWEQLLVSYRNLLDRLIAESQPRGDIESIAIYLDEKEEPGTQPPTPALEMARAALDTQREQMEGARNEELRNMADIYLERLEQRVRDHTRADELEQAIAAWNRMEEVREQLAGLTAGADGVNPANLGPNLFPQGGFDQVRAENWVRRIPGGDTNRSGFHIDTRAGQSRDRNTVLRIHQDERSSIFFGHPLSLEEGRRYKVSWRVSMARPWRSGIELRGKGRYQIGFQIDDTQFSLLNEQDRALLSRRATHSLEPPPGSAWDHHAVVLEAGPNMNQLFIEASRGEGEFLIDDIEVREIQSPGEQR
ncbi:MAG: hypothetical protein JJU05_00945 [Verrucomicrobia bacterium]|nr:hypothetical protein [Verrucomicrobiota bacterium]MCH8525949.1 hypothetical protein [Kiritimatiellia bacterium]